jgi:two-component system heavy metal sensor histidine kinase CusS
VLGYFEAAAQEQEIHLAGEGNGTLHGDADMIRQALANLVSNALEATPKGGCISVRVMTASGHAELEVQDTGRGIASEELPRILDRFYRTRDALDRNRPGTGLGLAIVQSIARLHGGELKIVSEPGKGTTALLRIPA